MLSLLFLLFAASPSVAQETPVRSLKEAYTLALTASESVGVSEQAVRQADALYRRAFGSSFPQLSFVHTTSAEDGSNAENRGVLRLGQSGLSGYKELAVARAAKATARQRAAEKRRAEQRLLQDVAGAWYGLLQARENRSASGQLKEFAEGRLKELRDRVRVGRSREADAIAQQSQIAALESQLEESARQEAARGDLLQFLTRATTVQADPGEGVLTPAPRALEDYLSRVEDRPDVAAARSAAAAAGAFVRAARAERLPQFSWQVDWRLYQPKADTADWDAGVSASLPLWAWGASQAGVSAAKAGLSAVELELQFARRAAELEVRNSHRDLLSAGRQLEVQRRAVDLAQRDYKLQNEDEARGLVTSIEVLQSLDRLNQARLALNNALLNAHLAAIDLDVAAGAAPLEILR